jgi:hypothetical protein
MPQAKFEPKIPVCDISQSSPSELVHSGNAKLETEYILHKPLKISTHFNTLKLTNHMRPATYAVWCVCSFP